MLRAAGLRVVARQHRQLKLEFRWNSLDCIQLIQQQQHHQHNNSGNNNTMTEISQQSGSAPSQQELQKRAERLRIGSVELLLRNCIDVEENIADVDTRVLEIAVLDARLLDGVDKELLAKAEELLEEAKAFEEGLNDIEPPHVLLDKLFDAVSDGNAAVVESCLDANAGTHKQLDIDVADHEGNTTMSEAACYNEIEILKLCLERGAHVDAQNDLGRTPLWRACYNGHLEAIRILLEHGADPSIPTNMGEIAGRYGTNESKALIADWDAEKTVEIRRRRSVQTWTRSSNSTKSAAPSSAKASAPPKDEIADAAALIPEEEPNWPIKIGLRDLQISLTTAHTFGKVPLIVSNGSEVPRRFLLYACEGMIDAKQLIAEVFIKKEKSLEEIQDELKETLLSAMETHGVGLGLHIRMSDSACDFKEMFCCAGKFPAEVFGGAARWHEDEIKKHFSDPKIIKQPDFKLIISTDFGMEDAVQHLASKLPFFEEMAMIQIEEEG
eukprot:TRINITY_DN9515_c0_g1_i1.p1 TRINITY_DN9515_c0_g1~~TRINITY_DN9515_c0_g1_i1.p1  ORF type:complete len:497 (+),score=107.77 TRINITY_DN9515_c0_g1_i1:40-1530(+)